MLELLTKAKSPRMCLIISAPRSGSTWLQTALNSHPEIFCTEHRFFGRFFEVWPDNGQSNSPRITLDRYVDLLTGYYRFDMLGMEKAEFKKELLSAFMSTFQAFAVRNSGKKLKILADKITPYLDTAGVVADSINRHFKDARIVFLIRDGRDVLTSGVFDWMNRKDHGMARYKHFIEGDLEANIDRFFVDEDIYTWSSYWNQSIETVAKIRTHPYILKYEELKANQADALGNLFKFLGVANSSQVIEKCILASSFGEMSAGRVSGEMSPTSKARKGIVGDWKNFFTCQDARLFETLAGPALVEWGYEADNTWINTIQNPVRCR